MTKYYAGIGSRETPEDILRLMRGIARGLAQKGYTLRSGGAKGADTAFEKGAWQDGGDKEIFYANDHLPKWTDVFVTHFHPAPDRLKDYPWKLMARNAMQILGRDGDSPVSFVVCWTPDGKGKGGTGQAVRIAQYYGIPVFDLKNDGTLEELKEFVRRNK